VSGSYDTEDGVLTLPSRALQAYRQVHGASALPEALSKPNTQQAIDVHSSLSTDFGAKGNLAVTTTYNQSTQRAVSVFFYANGLAYGLPPAGVDTAQYYQGLGASLEQSSVNSSQAQTRRLSGNASGTYRPNAWLTGNASLGTDLGNSTDVSVRPVGTTDQYDQGQASDYRRNNVGRTGNVGLTAIAKPGNLSYQSSLGVQYVYAHTDGLNADGSNLAPGSSSITTATYLVDSQIWSESVQLGTYGEEVIGFHDLLFLTGSLRIDGSTSYGDAYKPRPYPKVGLSWIASDEPFLHGLPGLDELRFRYSFGAASRAPTSLMKLGQIQSVQRTIEGQTQNEYQRVGLANPNIRPERTQESEYGMDATLFSGFLQARLTGYSRRTNDQINTINEPNGLPFQQWVNVGDVSGSGLKPHSLSMRSIVLHGIWMLDSALTINHKTRSAQSRIAESVQPIRRQCSWLSARQRIRPKVLGVADTAGGSADGIICLTKWCVAGHFPRATLSTAYVYSYAHTQHVSRVPSCCNVGRSFYWVFATGCHCE